jgi:hypothetical protein
MYTSIRPYTAGLAAVGASIIAVSLVSVPPNVDVAFTRRAEANAVQLAAATEIRAALASTTATVATALKAVSLPRTATVPSASPVALPAATTSGATNDAAATTSGVNPLAFILAIPLAVPIAAIWYLAAPITFPLAWLLARITIPPTSAVQTPALINVIEAFLAVPFGLALMAASWLSPAAAATGPSASEVVDPVASVAGAKPRFRATTSVLAKPSTASEVTATSAIRPVRRARAGTATPTAAAVHTKKAAAPAGTVRATTPKAAAHAALGSGKN